MCSYLEDKKTPLFQCRADIGSMETGGAGASPSGISEHRMQQSYLWITGIVAIDGDLEPFASRPDPNRLLTREC